MDEKQMAISAIENKLTHPMPLDQYEYWVGRLNNLNNVVCHSREASCGKSGFLTSVRSNVTCPACLAGLQVVLMEESKYGVQQRRRRLNR